MMNSLFTRDMMKKIFCQGYLWLLLLLLYSPILIIVIFSFTEARVMGNWTGFSLQLYKNLFAEGTHHSLTAALDLGASPMQALRKVIIPEILPGMISGFMLAITMSIDDFAVTIFTIGNEGLETLSTFIYADARKGGLTPELRPLSTIIFVLVLVMLIIINRRSDKTRRNKNEEQDIFRS